MDRAYKSGAATTEPSTSEATSAGFPSEGDVASGVAATVPGPYWFHMLTEEQRNVILAAGITPDTGTLTQLYDAIAALIAAAINNIPSSVNLQLATNNEHLQNNPPGNKAAQPAGVRALFDTLSGTPPGIVIPFAGTSAPTGWLLSFGQAVSRTTYSALFSVIGTRYGVGNNSTTFNLPDLRGRVIAGQDDMGGTSANRLTNQPGGLNGDVLGAAGGADVHTLTAAQIPSHSHGSGTLAASSAGSHSHSRGSLTASSAGSHSHGGGSLTASSAGSHTHTIAAVNGTSGGPGLQRSTGTGSTTTGSGGSHSHSISGSTSSGGSHSHSISGSTSSGGSHSHSISGSTGSIGGGGAHNNVQPTIILNQIIKT